MSVISIDANESDESMNQMLALTVWIVELTYQTNTNLIRFNSFVSFKCQMLLKNMI